MPRVHVVKKAAKAHKKFGIKKGDTYYWWYAPRTHRSRTRAPIIKSLKKPRASQLTASEYLKTLLSIQEDIEEERAKVCDEESLRALGSWLLMDKVQELRDLAEDQESKLENLPEGLKDAPTGELLRDRMYACNEAADQLDTVANDFESFEQGSDDGEWERKMDDLDNVNWDC